MSFPRYLFFSFLLVSFVMVSENAFTQRILGALSVGMNLTQVDGDDFYGFHKVGLNVGPEVIIPFGKNGNWSVSMELLYSQKGSYHKGDYDSTTYRLKMDYVEVPVLLHITDKKVVSGGLGFSYGQLVNYKETKNALFDSIYNYKTGLKNFDISVLGEVQVRLWKRLWAGLRYQYSLLSLREVDITTPGAYPRQTETRKQYNNVITIRLTWIFNQELLTKKSKRPAGNSQ